MIWTTPFTDEIWKTMAPSTIHVPIHPEILALPDGGNADSPLSVSECNQRLLLWATLNGCVDEDDLVWPSRFAIDQATSILLAAGESQMPTFLAPDGDGGVSLEWRAGNSSTRILVDTDGHVMRRSFRDSLLIDTQQY